MFKHLCALCPTTQVGGGGFPCYLRWQYKCLCSSSSWLCKQRQRWQRGGAASRTAPGPCTARRCHGRRCSWHGTDWRTPPPLRCSCRSSPSQTWGHTNIPFLRMLSTPTYGREMLLFVDDNLNQELLCVFMACRCFCVQAGKTTLPVFIHKWV